MWWSVFSVCDSLSRKILKVYVDVKLLEVVSYPNLLFT